MSEPKLPPEHTKTYQILQPRATHYRKATCMEVHCEFMADGWVSAIDESTDLGQAQGYYIRHESGRRFTEEKSESGLTLFVFVAGQKCFQQHVVSLDRTPKYVVRDGDHRGNPRGSSPIVRNARDWTDDFSNHQQTLSDKFNEG
jgi:hypothetical protein